MSYFRNIIFCGLFGILLALFMIGCGEDEEENIHDQARSAFIINGAAQTISVFDLDKLEMKNDVLTVGKWPADIKIRDDKAYVVNTGDNNVQIIDTMTITNAGLINIGDGTSPEKIGFVDDKAYVSCNWTASVKVVDLNSQSVTGEVPVGTAPWGVAVAGKKVYVCNTNAIFDVETSAMIYDQATISVIDSSTDKVIKEINVETNPTEIEVSGDKIIVQCTGNYGDITGKLCIIDTNSDTVTRIIDLRTTPSGMAISPDGKVYITTIGGVVAVDIDANSVGVPISEFANGSGLAFDDNGNGYICIPDWIGGGNDKLLIMDSSGKLTGTYTAGGGASIIALTIPK